MPLARHFLARFSEEEGRAFKGFAPAVEDSLMGYPWPGNVRQLENVVRRVVVLYDGETVEPAMVPVGVLDADGERTVVSSRLLLGGPEAGASRLPAGVTPFWQQERRIIEEALEAFGGNISRAAAALEIAPSTIYRKKQSWVERNA